MTHRLTITDLARLAAVPPRRVRYVLDHRVVPGLHGRVPRGAGRARVLAPADAFWAGAAALLLDAGLHRRAVAGLVGRLAQVAWAEILPAPPGAAAHSLPAALGGAARAALLVGDGAAVRVRADGADTGWVGTRPAAPLKGYRPRVAVHLDLTALLPLCRPPAPGPGSK